MFTGGYGDDDDDDDLNDGSSGGKLVDGGVSVADVNGGKIYNKYISG